MTDADYYVVKAVLSAEVCAHLVDYVKFKAKFKPNIRKSNDPLSGIHRQYGDLAMEMLLEKLTPVVEQVTQRALWPTLSFCYLYQHGNQLQRHRDRNSCEWVAGLCLGADDAFKARDGSWSLNLALANRVEAIRLNVGDLLIFRGHSTEHWRDAFSGEWFVSSIFGYVEQQGPFAFQKFDQRKSLGLPHVGMFRWTYGCFINRLKRVFFDG